MDKLKWNDINRLTVNQLDEIKLIKNTGTIYFESQIKAIFNHYNTQIQDRIDVYNKKNNNSKIYDQNTLSISKSEAYNQRPHYMAIKIYCNTFSFYLDELFNNCGILVSSNTNVWSTGVGIGKILQAIKEDIAYVANYSVLMCSDRISTDRSNNKLVKDTGYDLLYETINKRNRNQIGMFVKNITKIFEERKKAETPAQVEQKLTELPF